LFGSSLKAITERDGFTCLLEIMPLAKRNNIVTTETKNGITHDLYFFDLKNFTGLVTKSKKPIAAITGIY
tara:strand:+ start:295 stop:504 length:210 start_codon:yes stop_codon:yes gene_type:complete